MEITMKKIILIILALALLLTLFACGKKPAKNDQDTTYESSPAPSVDNLSGTASAELETDETDTSNGLILDLEEMTLDEIPVEEE